MAQKQLKGVGGVLGNLLSPPEAVPSAPPQESQDAPQLVQAAKPPEGSQPSTQPETVKAVAKEPGEKKRARLGRPLAGSRASEPIEREKVSLRLRSDLTATYRDWSWEEHCQFSDLVDRAMEHYLKSRRKARMPERE